MFVDKLDENKMRKIINGSATIKELDDYKKHIDNRLCYIIATISEITKVKLDWFDYDNLGESEYERGYFNSAIYKDKIGIVYNYKGSLYKGQQFSLYDESIPIEFLWSDFSEIVTDEFNKFKLDVDISTANKEEKKELRNKKLKEMVEQIKSKLTKEELSYIVFKKPE